MTFFGNQPQNQQNAQTQQGNFNQGMNMQQQQPMNQPTHSNQTQQQTNYQATPTPAPTNFSPNNQQSHLNYNAPVGPVNGQVQQQQQGFPAQQEQGFYQPIGTPLSPVQQGNPYQQIKQQLYYTQGMLPLELSFIENILRMNKGKIATIYMSFQNSDQWQSKIFKGVIEAAGRDHIIISDPNVGTRYVLLTIYLDYITFDEEINYYYPM